MGHSLFSLVFVQYCAILDSAVPVISCLLGSLCMWGGETLVLRRMLFSVWYITITFSLYSGAYDFFSNDHRSLSITIL